MQDRDDYALPEQSASSDEKTGSDTPKKVMIRETDPARLKALEYLGRRWLSHK
ncbi:hypothetical protein [Sinorhizobium meliloti]|uniref:hypothetical protein n=1 Tax=Rhizobium meliloti TaxID=382 RepID=UPI0018658F96|nr:hypothetical protein [Sinorhizobium meliloti]